MTSMVKCRMYKAHIDCDGIIINVLDETGNDEFSSLEACVEAVYLEANRYEGDATGIRIQRVEE